MVFCNKSSIKDVMADYQSHNPYFNRWFSAIKTPINYLSVLNFVTILILIDGFLQYGIYEPLDLQDDCHNPYFNRWFSAIWFTKY